MKVGRTNRGLKFYYGRLGLDTDNNKGHNHVVAFDRQDSANRILESNWEGKFELYRQSVKSLTYEPYFECNI